MGFPKVFVSEHGLPTCRLDSQYSGDNEPYFPLIEIKNLVHLQM